MKILMLGVYRDGTGWSRACLDYILSLDAAGVDVVPRAVKLNDAKPELPERILELESKSAAGCDVVIQHLLPHQYQYDGRFINIGMYATETSNFRAATWAERINLLDGAIVFNHQQVEASRDSGVTVPISVVPHATDVTRFQRNYEPIPGLSLLKKDGQFLFYTIGEMVRRKNLAALLKAFHTEFAPEEPVQLVIKTSRPGMSQEELRNHIGTFCAEIKKGLKLHGGKVEAYKQEIVITDRMSDTDVCRFHSSCDCFVQPSYGEAWSITAFDAMGFGKTPIVTDWAGYREYVSDETGWLVKAYPETVFGINDSFEDLYTGNETWAAVDVGHLRRCMRDAYQSDSTRKEKALKGMQRAYSFSYEAIGTSLKEALLKHESQDRPLGEF